jgi:hypothetical protein
MASASRPRFIDFDGITLLRVAHALYGQHYHNHPERQKVPQNVLYSAERLGRAAVWALSSNISHLSFADLGLLGDAEVVARAIFTKVFDADKVLAVEAERKKRTASAAVVAHNDHQAQSETEDECDIDLPATPSPVSSSESSFLFSDTEPDCVDLFESV